MTFLLVTESFLLLNTTLDRSEWQDTDVWTNLTTKKICFVRFVGSESDTQEHKMCDIYPTLQFFALMFPFNFKSILIHVDSTCFLYPPTAYNSALMIAPGPSTERMMKSMYHG